MQRYIDELLGHRADLEPDDLREGDRRRPRLRRPDRRARRARARGRAALLRARAHRPAPRREAVRGDQRAHRPRRRLGLARGLAAARRRRRRRRSSRLASCTRRPSCNVFIKIPGTDGGPHRDRGVDLRRRSRSTSRCCSRREQYLGAADALHARGRAPDRGRSRPGRAIGGLAVHQPLGRRGRRPGARTSFATGSGSRSAGAPTAPTASCSTPTRCQRLANEGARPQRLLWASTGTKDPDAPDTLYVEALAAPFTINTMPEKTLLAFAEHGDGRRAAARRRRRRRGDAGRLRRGRHRRRRARRPAAGGGRGGVRRLLARAARDGLRASSA